MRNTRSQAARLAASLANLCDVLPLFAPYIADIRELVLLGSCSRRCSEVVKQYVAESLVPLLTKMVEDAYFVDFDDPAMRQEFESGITWVLSVVGNLAPSASGPILMLPRVAHAVQEVMLESGFSFTYDQLIAAARQRVAGVESWVQMLEVLELHNDLPQIAVEMACAANPVFAARPREVYLNDLNTNNVGDILHLAVNLSNDQSMARSILTHLLEPVSSESHQALRDQMTPQLLQELLQTAVERGHADVLQQLCEFPAVNDLDRAAVQQLFTTAMQHYKRDGFRELLDKLAVPELTLHLGQFTIDLLELAVRLKSVEAVRALCRLGGARRIMREELEQLLQCIVSGPSLIPGTVTMLNDLCSLPAAQGVSWSCTSNCLIALISSSNSIEAAPAMNVICSLHPAWTLPAASLEDLISSAITRKFEEAAMQLITSRAAANLDVQTLLRLLQQSFFLYDTALESPAQARVVAALLDLPAAANISASAAAELTSHAMDSRAHDVLPVLCSRLDNLTAADILRLIYRVARRDGVEDGRHVCYLLRAPAAQQLTVQQMQQVLLLVVWYIKQAEDEEGSELVHEYMQAFCSVFAAQPPEAARQALQRLTLDAIKEGCKPLVQAMLSLPAATALSAADVGDLFTEAMMQGMHDVAGRICRHMSAHALQTPPADQQQDQQQQQLGGIAAVQDDATWPSTLDSSLIAALQRRRPHVILDLMHSSEAAGLFTSDRIELLIHHAVEQHCLEVLQPLCALPAVADIPAPLVERMLSCVMQQFTPMFAKLCRLPLVNRLQPAAAARLLRQAQKDGNEDDLEILLEYVQAVDDLDTDTVVTLIKDDLQLYKLTVLERSYALHYMNLPAVQHLDTDQVTDLLRTANTLARWDLVESLCSTVPAAQELSAAAAEDLLQRCIYSNDRNLRRECGELESALPMFLQLPSCQQISPAAVQGLLLAAIFENKLCVMQQLMHLPAAADLTAGDVQQLLGAAVCTSKYQVKKLRCLGELPACMEVQAAVVVEVFELALVQGRPLSVNTQANMRMQRTLLWLLRHPAMRQVGCATLSRLLCGVRGESALRDVASAMTSMLAARG